MKLLLDSHALLWLADDEQLVGANAMAQIRNSRVPVYVSVATLWELSIKISIGKLELRLSLQDLLKRARQAADVQQLPIRFRHLTLVQSLPLHHRDPFDRLLIAQAISDDLTIASRDGAFAAYDVRTVW